MVQALRILCLISGISLLVKRPKIKALSPSQFPDVPEEQFDEWKRHEMRSVDLFLWAGWGLLLISIPAELLFAILWPGGEFALGLILGVTFLIILIASATSGTKASRIKKQYGFRSPKW